MMIINTEGFASQVLVIKKKTFKISLIYLSFSFILISVSIFKNNKLCIRQSSYKWAETFTDQHVTEAAERVHAQLTPLVYEQCIL